MLTSVAADEKQSDGKRGPDDDYINPGATFRCALDARVDVLRPLNSLRCDFKRPCDNERHWKPDRDEGDDQSDDPIWNLEEGKNLRCDLNEKPTDNRVRDR